MWRRPLLTCAALRERVRRVVAMAPRAHVVTLLEASARVQPGPSAVLCMTPTMSKYMSEAKSAVKETSDLGRFEVARRRDAEQDVS